MTEGKCRGTSPSVFFADDGVGINIARRICVACPVKVPCLEYALRNQITYGIWGGVSERDRRRIARREKGAGDSPVGGRPLVESS